MANKRIDRITIEIKTGNAAFDQDVFGEVARVLQRLASRIDGVDRWGESWQSRPETAHDSNGNTVAEVTYHEATPAAEEYTWADAREMATACNARAQHVAVDRLDVRFADGSHRVYDHPETAVDDMADMLADIDGSVDF